MELSIRKFIADLQQVQDGAIREMMRFQLQLAMKIQAKTRENIKKTFGAGTGDKSPLTERGYGSTARRSGRGGGLANSVVLEQESPGSISVSVGGNGVPYAAIHEQGGTVRPVNAHYLTIPFSPEFGGARAGEFNLKFGVDPAWGKVLVRASAKAQGGRYNEGDIAFLLRQKARIPARPYFEPAVEEVTSDPSVAEVMRQVIGRSKLGVEVV